MNPMMPMTMPASQVRLVTEFAHMAIESQMVINLRLAGMFGFMAQSPDEPFRMLAEKQAAASESLFAMTKAATEGASPETVMSAAMRPYGDRTRANSLRLARVA